VTAHFTATWAPPREDFAEALPNTDIYLDQRIPAEGSEEMEEYVAEEKHIRDVINSRDDLSACGVNGGSYQLFKAAKQGSIEFMKHIIEASIRGGRVMTSWREARTILLHKKGNREVISDRQLMADFDHKLRLLDFHVPIGKRVPGHQRNVWSIYRSPEGFHQEDEWMQ
jgi:hypothetical protein